jgi:ankyrin repeat protein
MSPRASRGKEVAVPHCPLPEDPSLENLKKQAKTLLKRLRAGDDETVRRFRELHPRAEAKLERPILADVQLALARLYGFPSWASLRRHVVNVERFAWDLQPAATESESVGDAFVRLACLEYERWRPTHLEGARRLLREHPELTRESLHAAAAAGDVGAARAWLEREPALARSKVGPFGWEPLLYACYSRFDARARGDSTLEVARELLAHGADPDAGFLWHGNVPPFTALTGAFGEGEDGVNQPPHPERDALARLLLEAGADPNDGQTLYNRHFLPDDGHLRLLFEFGLGRASRGPWIARFGERMGSPQAMLVEELWAAARKGFVERARLLLEHGVDPNARGQRDGRTPWESAMLGGRREIAELLERHGARPIELSPEERFVSACAAGEARETRELVRQHPDILERLGEHGRARIVSLAAEARSEPGLRLAAELGLDLSPLARTTPMHDAAWAGDVELVRLLLELGADPTVREPTHGGTPLGWAAHNGQRAVFELLLPHADVFDAVRCDGVERAAELLGRDPGLAAARDASGNPLAFYVQAGARRADELLDLLHAHGVDLDARDAGGRTALDAALAAGQEELAARLRRHGAHSAAELDPAAGAER